MHGASETLRDRILRRRNCGIVACMMMADGGGPDATRRADVLASVMGLRELGDRWLTIDAELASRLTARVLHRDLAYGNELMREEEAVAFSREFIAAVPSPCAYFTNGTWSDGHPPSLVEWEPLTKATFDAGVACVGEKRVSILWVADED